MPSAAPAPSSTVPRAAGTPARLTGPLVTAGAVAAVTVGLRLRDPHDSGSWGYCPWKLLTGLDCPGCGSLRAVNDLTHGDLVAAASSNLLFVVAVPVVVVLWLLWARRSWTGTDARGLDKRTTKVLWSATLAVTLAFTVLRNTPWGTWLHS
jgi:uncharacterized protein DUF2752